MTIFARHERSLTAKERKGLRGGVWIAAALVAACASGATDAGTTATVGSVSITPASATVSVGRQVPLQAVVQDPSGRTITGADIFWSVQSPSIATVSNTGVVTGVGSGSTQVAASVNGKSGTATITVGNIPVASVVVTPSHVDAAPGVQTQLSAAAYDGAQNPLSGRSITWSTSNAAVANVDANGMMTAVSVGSATITASSEGKTGTATVTVTQSAVAVATVTVTPSPLATSIGQQTQLAATLKDAAGNVLNGRTVTWSSSNTGVATVSAQGVLTAVAAGSTTITATSEGKSGTSAVTVSNAAVGSVTVQPQGPSIVLGATVQLTATIRDVNGNVVTDRVVTWSSSNAAIATVNAGVVTGVAVGTATITATSEGKSGSATVTVISVPVASVTITPPSPDTVVVGSTMQLAAVTKDASGNVLAGRVVTWQSSNTADATVGATGLVTGVTVGTATITATSEGKSGAITLVSIKAPVGSVVVAPSVDSVTTTGSHSTKTIAATVKDVNGTVVTDRIVNWTITPGAVASVSPSSGASTTVTGGSVGQAQVTATSETKNATASIKVMLAVTSVEISPSSALLNILTGSTVQLTAAAKAADNTTVLGRTIAWTSDNESVAKVDATGKVTAQALAGVAHITATVVFDGVASAIPATITVILP